MCLWIKEKAGAVLNFKFVTLSIEKPIVITVVAIGIIQGEIFKISFSIDFSSGWSMFENVHNS